METWETDVTAATADAENATQTANAPSSINKIDTLKELTFRILREVQSIREVNMPSIDSGIDFYDEVTRFEVDLIKRALMHTGGHQGRAARLLNLKITTLNSKIKHYGIETGGFAPGVNFAETLVREAQKRSDSVGTAVPMAVG